MTSVPGTPTSRCVARRARFGRGIALGIVCSLASCFGWLAQSPGANAAGRIASTNTVTSLPFRPTQALAAPRLRGSAIRVQPSALRLVSYYPAAHPWAGMWTQYSHTDTDADFGRAAALGANAVRIIVIPEVLGFTTGQVSASDSGHFADILATAAAHGLSVQLTLFDTATYVDPATGTSERYADHVQLTMTWLTALLAPYRNDPRIALVELENEMDPYDSGVLGWARTILGWLPTVLPAVPRTASTWGSSDGSREAALVSGLGSTLDVLDAHLYGTPGENALVLRALTGLAAGRPVIIGEGGRTSGLIRSTGGDQAQAKAYSAILETAHQFGIADLAPWTLLDLTPAGTPAWLSPRDEANFGLYRTDGSLKPAGDVVRSMFAAVAAGTAATPMPSPGNLDGGFEREDATPVSGTTLGSWQEYLPGLAGRIGIAGGEGVAGSAAAMLSQTSNSSQGWASLYQHFAGPAAGTAITVTAQVRIVAGTGCSTIAVAFFAGDIYQSNVTAPCAATANTGWQTLTLHVSQPSGATEFQVYLQSAGNAGTAYFDNVSVAQG